MKTGSWQGVNIVLNTTLYGNHANNDNDDDVIKDDDDCSPLNSTAPHIENNIQLSPEGEVNNGGYILRREASRCISTALH